MKIFLLTLSFIMCLSQEVYAKQETIVFAAGCFWGVEKKFENTSGVISAKSGYAGGNYDNPTYKQVLRYRVPSAGIINHAEAVEVVFDNNKISANSLLQVFWEMHNPTQENGQGNDIGNNYRSAIFYTNQEQKQTALSTKKQYQKLLIKAGYDKIATQIAPLNKFYVAEEYHQNYLKRNPNGYCPNHATGVKFGKSSVSNATIKPLGGKEIIVIDAPFCPYCEKFKQDVTADYKGDITLRTTEQQNLTGFNLKAKLEASPIILFIQDGKEVFRHTGYMNKDDFYQELGKFKLGVNSDAYGVAFSKGTDNRFCKQYDIFKNTPDGVFVDKLSGDALFDTKDRFNSNSGWLSFVKAVDGATIQKADFSYGMQRVEVIAKNSGIHLGHVFNDGPNGKPRFCINATVLDFVAR